MADPRRPGIDGFTTIASNVSLYRPHEGPREQSTTQYSPTLIVLCSWMGAAPKHIAKYTTGHQTIFPHAAILLVQSSLGDAFASDQKQRTRLEISCDTILSFMSDDAKNNTILLHAMSNGGAIAATRMATIFKERDNGKIFSKLVCDCMPSKPNVEKSVEAVSIGLPKNFLIQFLVKLILRIWMHVGMFIHVTLLRQEDILTKMRRLLNGTQLFNSTASRLYMYSKKDKLVPYEDVHDHANDARMRERKDVKEVVFEKAPHCFLIMEDAQLYWDSIRTLMRS